MREDYNNEFGGTNAPDVHNRGVDTREVNKDNRGHVTEKLLLIVENQMVKLLVMELMVQLLTLLTVEKSNVEKMQEKIVVMNS